jgi:hypothetical protein
MATKKKKSKTGKRSVKRSKTANIKRPPKRKSSPNKPKAENHRIRVRYDHAAQTVSVLDPQVTVHKCETLIKWVAAPRSDPFTFTLGSPLKCPFGTPTLESNNTVIELKYHGNAADKNSDFIYELTLVPGLSEVEMSADLVLGGSTIKNH